jgi:transposase-like protein
LSEAVIHQGESPDTTTLDGYATSHRAVREMKADGLLREDNMVWSSKYTNNLIEQDDRKFSGILTVLESACTGTVKVSGWLGLTRLPKQCFTTWTFSD